jgi:hypothetical protein
MRNPRGILAGKKVSDDEPDRSQRIDRIGNRSRLISTYSRKNLIVILLVLSIACVLILTSILYYIALDRDYPHVEPGVILIEEQRTSVNITINVTRVGGMENRNLSLSEFLLRTTINETSSVGLSLTPLTNLSRDAYNGGVIFKDAAPFGYLNAGDKFILDRSTYGNGSAVTIFVTIEDYAAAIGEIVIG